MNLIKKINLAKLRHFLKKKYRIILLNDSTLGEKISFKLTPVNLLIVSMAIIILMTGLIISLIALTSLREYIPGYGNLSERKKILELSIRADSIEQVLGSRDLYIKSIINVFDNHIEVKPLRPKKDSNRVYSNMDNKPSERDLAFRKDFEQTKNKPTIAVKKTNYFGLEEFVFFTPVDGFITESFDLKENHYGVDVVTKINEMIKTTIDGTVIFSGFSQEDGKIIHIQHANNLISIYKHCSELFKKTGDRVKSGEIIAMVGNTGERSKGPHLHFELWCNGAAINPQDFVVF